MLIREKCLLAEKTFYHIVYLANGTKKILAWNWTLETQLINVMISCSVSTLDLFWLLKLKSFCKYYQLLSFFPGFRRPWRTLISHRKLFNRKSKKSSTKSFPTNRSKKWSKWSWSAKSNKCSTRPRWRGTFNWEKIIFEMFGSLKIIMILVQKVQRHFKGWC